MAAILPVISPTPNSRTKLQEDYDEARNRFKKLFESNKPAQEIFSSEEEEWDPTVTLDPKEAQECVDFFKEYAPIQTSKQPSLF